jgi:hypothetical protein
MFLGNTLQNARLWMRKGMVLNMLVYSPCIQLTQLVAQHHFAAFSYHATSAYKTLDWSNGNT